jgi:hypothetical protein
VIISLRAVVLLPRLRDLVGAPLIAVSSTVGEAAFSCGLRSLSMSMNESLRVEVV